MPRAVVFSTRGKGQSEHTYSFHFSILAEASEGLRFKLLIRPDASSDEYDDILASFLTFLAAYHGGTLEAARVEQLAQARVVGTTMLLAFSSESRVIEPIDPIEKERNDEA